MAAQGDGSSPCCTRKELAHDGKLLFSGRGLTGRTLTVVAPDGAETGFAAGQALCRLLPLFWVVLGWELAIVFLQTFSTGSIRRRLRPLNELAIKAEMLSGSEDSEKMEHLRQAISSVSANAAEVQVCTGDKDLLSIEIAINNLLKRMQEAQKQQTRFVSDASHELRTPISVIQGYVNMLDRWSKDDPAVLNEAKFSPEGSVITLSARGDQGRVSYAVQDEGIGMKQSDAAHIFERFYRSDDTRTSSTGGSGLGLSIAKWIIDAHAGTVEVLSRLDLGTRFTVTFPSA